MGLGQISCDRVAALPRWPLTGQKLALAAPALAQPGGQIATAVLAAARLGLSARLLGAVGDDLEAGIALAPLAGEGVDLSRVRRIAGAPTRSALVLVDPDGERTVLGHRDPRLALRPADLSRDAIREARVLLVDAEDPDAARWAVAAAHEGGAATVLDAERADPARVSLALEVDFPILSESFCAGPEESLEVREHAVSDWLTRLARGRARLAVVTCGARGARAHGGEQRFAQPAIAVAAIDTTGAGDVFRGAFVWALLRGAAAPTALRLAAAAAALACRGQGAQGALPTAAEVEEAAR